MSCECHDVRQLHALSLANLNDFLGGLKAIHLRHVAVHKDDFEWWLVFYFRLVDH